MRIAQLAPTYERVPPRTYGGTELVVHLLTEELVRRGHDVTLFATGDSLTKARLRSVTAEPVRYGEATDDGLSHAEYLQLANAQACFLAERRGEFDVIHNHAGIEGMVLAEASATPVVSTMHNPYVPRTRPIWDAYPWFHHAVSAASVATFPARGALPPIHHGIDVASFAVGEPQGYLLFLGRFSPAKGADRAIEAARLAGRRLILAGKINALLSGRYNAMNRPSGGVRAANALFLPENLDAAVPLLNLLREAITPPPVSAALYRAAALIPGVTVVADTTDAIGRHGVAVALDGRADRRDFDAAMRQAEEAAPTWERSTRRRSTGCGRRHGRIRGMRMRCMTLL